MSKQLGQEWIGSVSHGTMREEDLVPAFESVLRQNKVKLPKRPIAVAKMVNGRRLSEREREQVSYYLEDLFDSLNEIAPEGCYFGANEGDGADYGFWPCEQE